MLLRIVEMLQEEMQAGGSKLVHLCRWAVTGTPINTGLEDLYGLLLFLRAEPYSERVWWQKLCQQPYEQGSLAGPLPAAVMLTFCTSHTCNN